MLRVESNSKLVMIGDSITDCGRERPVGEMPWGGLGNGYVNVIAGLLGATHPEQRILVVNVGTSGNTVRDLKARWQEDVLGLAPDWLSIMIGVNDVWRQFDCALMPERHVLIDEYAEVLEELVASTRPRLRGLVLMAPFFIEPSREDPMRRLIDRYGAAVRGLAERHDAVFVDTQAAFDVVLEHRHSYMLAGDRVHPNIVGHTVIARAFLTAIGFAW